MLGGFVKDDYKTERLWASASDGTQVPISLVYRKDALKKDGSMPMLLDGSVHFCFNLQCCRPNVHGTVLCQRYPRVQMVCPHHLSVHTSCRCEQHGAQAHATCKLCLMLPLCIIVASVQVNLDTVFALALLAAVHHGLLVRGAQYCSLCRRMPKAFDRFMLCMQLFCDDCVFHAMLDCDDCCRYGSYEMSNDPYLSTTRLCLLDRGFVYAIAHVRGGGEMGRKWYENGKYLHKKNTFTDFIACAEHLIEQGYTSSRKLCIEVSFRLNWKQKLDSATCFV